MEDWRRPLLYGWLLQFPFLLFYSWLYRNTANPAGEPVVWWLWGACGVWGLASWRWSLVAQGTERIRAAGEKILARGDRWVLAAGFAVFLAISFRFVQRFPFIENFQQGDAQYFSQMADRAFHHWPQKTTVYAIPEVPEEYRQDPVWGVKTDFESAWIPANYSALWPSYVAGIFAALPIPNPHILVIVFFFVIAGGSGFYFFCLRESGDRLFSMGMTALFLSFPLATESVFNRGYYDLFGYAVLPWVFWGLTRARPSLIPSIILNGIGLSWIYLNLAVSVGLLGLKGLRRPGVFLLAGTLAWWLAAKLVVWVQPEISLVPAGQNFLHYLWAKDLDGILGALLFHFEVLLLMAGLGVGCFWGLAWLSPRIWKNEKWLVAVLFLTFGIFINLWRSYGYGSHRSSMYVVPALVLLVMAWIEIRRRGRSDQRLAFWVFLPWMAALLLTWYWRFPMDLHNLISHRWDFPAQAPLRAVVERIETQIPPSARLVYQVVDELEAVASRRSWAWRWGRAPADADYLLLVCRPRCKVESTRDEKIEDQVFQDLHLLIYKRRP